MIERLNPLALIEYVLRNEGDPPSIDATGIDCAQEMVLNHMGFLCSGRDEKLWIYERD